MVNNSLFQSPFLLRKRMGIFSYSVKAGPKRGTCKQGERADLTGCIPASGDYVARKVDPKNPRFREESPEAEFVGDEESDAWRVNGKRKEEWIDKEIAKLQEYRKKERVVDLEEAKFIREYRMVDDPKNPGQKKKVLVKAELVTGNGKPVPEHIKKAGIPPTSENIKINLDPDARVYAIYSSVSKRGRLSGSGELTTTKIYNPEFDNSQYAKLMSVVAVLSDRIEECLKENESDRGIEGYDQAIVAWLMMEQGTRIGGEDSSRDKKLAHLMGKKMTPDNIVLKVLKDVKTGKPLIDKNTGEKRVSVWLSFGSKPEDQEHIADSGVAEQLKMAKRGERPLMNSTYWLKAWGASNLMASHVVKDGKNVRLQFVGKDGVWQDHVIRNPKLAAELLKRRDAAKSGNSPLFVSRRDKKINIKKATEIYMKALDGKGFTPKDFRAARATREAITLMSQVKKAPKTPKEYFQMILGKKEKDGEDGIATRVASLLGNKPAQSFESYIHPSVFERWRDGIPKKLWDEYWNEIYAKKEKRLKNAKKKQRTLLKEGEKVD